MNFIVQRLKSKTYRVGMVGLLITVLEINSGVITGWVPVDYRPWLILIWPMLMFTLREMTNSALGDK